MRRIFGKPGFRSMALAGIVLTALALVLGGCSQPSQDQAIQEPPSNGKSKSERAEEAFRESEAIQEALATSPAAVDLAVPPEELAALEAKVDGALATYEELSEGTKRQFAAEKAKLDAVKTKIGHVYTAHAFQGNHAEALAHTPEELDTPEEAVALLPKLNAALGAAKALPKTVQELLQDDIAFLENLIEKAEELASLPPPPVQYTITFDSHGGSELGPITENEGTVIEEPNSTRTGYTLDGWFTAASGGAPYAWPYTLTESVAMHAQWTAITYTVKYNANDGSGATTSSTHTYDVEEEKLTVNSFTRTGFDFREWNTDPDGNGDAYADEASVFNWSSVNGAEVNLHAQWTPITYTVTYHANNGSGATTSSTHTYDTEKPLTKNTFAKIGYTFEKWTTESGGGGDAYADEANVSNLRSVNGTEVKLYAQWTPIAYTVQYNANGGEGTMTPSVHTYNVEKEKLTANSFTRDGFKFGEWNTDPDGNGVAYGDEASVLNLSSLDGVAVPLYAQWWPEMSVNITVWKNDEDGKILVSAGHITISKDGSGGNSDSFTAEVNGVYSGIRWHLNGDPISGNRGAAQSIVINAKDHKSGDYYLGVSVNKGGLPYSTVIRFTVDD